MKLFWPKSDDWKAAISHLHKHQPLPPFDQDVLKFVQALSKQFVKMRQYPEIVALGFWLRKAHIHEMEQEWLEQTKSKVVKARGTVFHLAPSNVDTIFVYSWMLSLLTGNANIVRVSSKEMEQTNALLSVILEEIKKPEHRKISERTVILTYEHDREVTEFLSESCHTRVIWGGDETIRSIRQVPLAPMANELVFPDRFSLSIISAEAIMGANDAEKANVLEQFYNDSFWFDQMACSSPRLIVWTGSADMIEKAQAEFWSLFEKVILQKQYELMAATQVQKFATGLWLAAEREATEVKQGTFYSRISFEQIPQVARERHCGGGLFFECAATDLSEVSKMIVDKDQTVTYFGYTEEELIDFVSRISTRGIDRVVPIGQALHFDGVWDGQSFLRSFTREVVVIV